MLVDESMGRRGREKKRRKDGSYLLPSALHGHENDVYYVGHIESNNNKPLFA